MDDLFARLVRFFEADHWTYQVSDAHALLRMLFKGENGQWTVFAQAIEAHRRVVIYSALPFPIPPEKRMAMAEFITRANHGMVLGNFELDFSDGELRYKTSVDVSDGELSEGMIRALLLANVVSMDRYMPGVLRLLAEAADPGEVVAMVEAG